MKDNFN